MTDFDAATAWHNMKAATAALCVIAAGLGLTGCETAGNIFGGGNELASQTAAPAVAPAAAQPQQLASIALAPIIGAPEAVAGQMRTQLEQSAGRNRVTILADRDPKADFGMRGYLVAARDKAGVKVSYIWDITDPSGKRVNRITGEEMTAAAANGKDSWSAVTPQVSQAIADKVAASLGAWAPSQAKSVPVASAAPPAAVGAAALNRTAAAPAGPIPAVASAPATNATTASLPAASAPLSNGALVSGAPGDGNAALSTALRLELAKQGVQLGATHNVEGKVTMGAVKDGKQSIQIDWRVKDSRGAPVGTVTQKNAVPPGSLDGSWGKTADAAAAAAAQGIVKLLPKTVSSTN